MKGTPNLAEQKHGPARVSRKADRLFILKLTKALGISRRNVKRDECGDWNVVARRGHVATDGVSFYVYVRVRSPRRWKGVKRTLQFLGVTQDGDDEGIFILREMPTSEQAATIRKVLGLRKAPELTDKQRASRQSNFPRKNRTISSDFSDVIGAAATDAPRMKNSGRTTDPAKARKA